MLIFNIFIIYYRVRNLNKIFKCLYLNIIIIKVLILMFIVFILINNIVYLFLFFYGIVNFKMYEFVFKII